MSESLDNQWAPWENDAPWIDGQRVMPEWTPEFVALDPTVWNHQLVMTGGQGWMPDGVPPYPTPESDHALTPIPPAQRSQGPGTPVARQRGDEWLAAHGRTPQLGDAERQLEELNARRLQPRPWQLTMGGPIRQSRPSPTWQPTVHRRGRPDWQRE
jgi:hypothetical protein